MRIAVVGATGLVGRVMLEELASGDFSIPVDELVPIASARSEGKQIEFKGQSIPVIPLTNENIPEVDIALFSAGADSAEDFAPLFVEKGAFVIDNSSAFRRDKKIPLVVPEINADTIGNAKLIANPNCTTIQLVLALAPLRKYGIQSINVSTYQAISGGMGKVIKQFIKEFKELSDWLENSPREELVGINPYSDKAQPVFFTNVVPAIGEVCFDGDFTEEQKVKNETRRILDIENLHIAVTAVRVPVLNGHSEAVTVELKEDFCIGDIFNDFKKAEGIIVSSNYITPIEVSGSREVFVSRVRRDAERENIIYFWVVADNLRKGAATNAIQIAEKLSVPSR